MGASSFNFQETQKFTQWWLWLIILAPIILTGLKIVSSIMVVFSGYIPDDSGNNSMMWIANRIPLSKIVFVLLYLLTILFLAIAKLKVVVSDTIKIRHLMFFKKVISLSDIVEATAINYDFVGYGIRKTKKYGTVYNVKGKEGISLTLKNGKKYLIGTQRSQEFLKSISKNS